MYAARAVFTAVSLARTCPRAWIAVGAFCCAVTIASVSEMGRPVGADGVVSRASRVVSRTSRVVSRTASAVGCCAQASPGASARSSTETRPPQRADGWARGPRDDGMAFGTAVGSGGDRSRWLRYKRAVPGFR